MKYGKSLQELAIELARQNQAKHDLLVDTPALQMTHRNGALSLSIDSAQSASSHIIEQLGISEIAHRQMGQHLSIPAKYYDKMRTDFPELLTQNVNGWFNQAPTRRMIRTLDGTARAFLSDRYRRIDNYDVAQTVLPIIGRMEGANIESCDLTDQRLYIKVVDPRVTAEIVKGDVVQAGVIITNSEVGLGSVNVSPLIYRLVCSNGMIAADAGIRKYHVGRLNERGSDNYEIYRDETIEADDRAFLMKLEDTVHAAVDQAQFAKLVDRLRESTEAKIEGAVVPKVVELAASEFNLTQDEGKGVLGHLIEGGDLSLYGLANAVTRHARDVESYDRSTELEGIGYKVIMINPTLWRRINSEAAK